MKNRVIKLIFLGLFVMMCLLPLVGILIAGPAGAAANEILSDPPSLHDAEGKINLNYLKDASDYLADHFFLRQEFVTADAVIEAGVFHDSACEDVVLGKEGWLFYTSTLDDYRGLHVMTDRELHSAARTMALIQEYAQAHGADFLFTVAANKNTLYPQYMPEDIGRSGVESNLERLRKVLEEYDVNFTDLGEGFREQDAVLYHRQDSHWNNLGAGLACDQIMASLGRQSWFYDPDRYAAKKDFRGDLYEMLYPTGIELDEQLYPNWTWSYTYDRPIRSAEDQLIYTSCPDTAGTLLMFRDSFGNTLHPFMAECYGEACFSRAMPYDLSLFNEIQPDQLIIEIVERNLDWLLTRAPVMAAPIRTLELPEKSCAIEANAACTQTTQTLFCCSGNILQELDTDSPIYLLSDGVIYEAAPAGDGQNAFTAYLPSMPETVQILFMQNGELILSKELYLGRNPQ